ncbi:hypothetical protein [Spiroplasma ixodetis]|uniref:Uncharacterized protein n=1 Tax=Spiroplasma ixodetis TaxID=2141 RepID=A0ABM8BTG5_9MOLU|nr:hypothetical protein [Spiroplasma ixodetis]BDT02922.1 hypothetical protein SHM_05680 [Spiroplasma ixodetis]
MKLNEFNNAFQTEQQCLAYIANLKENKCIRCFSFNLRTSPHMYLWRKQWNWMSSIILFKLKNNVLHI